MTEGGIPENWSAAKAANMGNASQFPKSQMPEIGPQPPEEGDAGSRQLPQRSVDRAVTAPVVKLGQLHRPEPDQTAKTALEVSVLSGKSPPAPSMDQSAPHSPKWQGWFKKWVFWGILAALISSGLGFVSVLLMLRLPSTPNCPSIFWPLASATVRLNCAQIAASKQTVDDLLEAINLVKALPSDNPLHAEIKEHIEEWSQELLDLAEGAFQAGKLDEAIASARKIPQDAPGYQSVEDRISRWQSIWSQGEEIYQQTQSQMSEQRWRQAFRTAVQLLNVKNEYWKTTKYEELTRQIETARVDGEKLLKAKSLVETGGVAKLSQAIELLETIAKDSYVYQDAQDTIPELGRKMLSLAQEALERENADQAIKIASQIPASANLQSEVEDFNTLAEAWRSAWVGTTSSLSGAIATAENIGSDRPLYAKAQELISRWQLEIQDVNHLERARTLAQGGNVDSLNAAIAEVQLVPDTNPRAEEAQQESNRWRRQIESIEDRPYLDRAEEMASVGDTTSLQAAIDEVSKINRGRSLYQDARRKIRTWTRKIQRIEDQPYLEEARTLASNGDLPAAIAAAQRIQPGRALSGEAQAAIDDWQGQIRARENWQIAQQVAIQGTPDSLAQAIRLANRVPTTSPLRPDVNLAINNWSQQLFSIAMNQSRYDIPGAIGIAKRIPSSSDAYQTAQEQIKAWEEVLNPASREQGAGSREQGVGSREQGVGSREQGAGSRDELGQ